MIVRALWMTVYDVDEACECFQGPKLLNTLGTDVNQIRSRISTVGRFPDLLSASPSPIAPVEDAATVLPVPDNKGPPLWRCPVSILCRLPRPCLRSRFKPAPPDSLSSLLPVPPIASGFKSQNGRPPSNSEPCPDPLITCQSPEPYD
jgi:hypothetical protein